jgi:hypothetical protein
VPDEAKDLEVLDAGKALRRSARDRLMNHEKLQEMPRRDELVAKDAVGHRIAKTVKKREQYARKECFVEIDEASA